MANIKSAKKRIQTAERNRLQNKAYKSVVRTLTKKYFTEVEAYSATPSAEGLERVRSTCSLVYSKIDKAVKRRALHANNGARKKARLAQALKAVEEAAS